MNVSGAAGSAWTAPPASSGGSAKSAAAGNSPEQEFLDYMKLTPAQRFEEDWLRAHGMTRKDLDSMKPEERQKIAEEMRQDFERQMKEQAQSAKPVTGKTLDLMA